MPSDAPAKREKKVTVTLTAADFEELRRYVLQRKLNDSSLPSRWGASELISGLLREHLRGVQEGKRS